MSDHRFCDHGVSIEARCDECRELERQLLRRVVRRVRHVLESEWERTPDGTEVVTVHRLRIALSEMPATREEP